jgi:NhaP-type Na+/H+ and K+/H+ antiporter
LIRGTARREVLLLVAMVLAVDLVFVAVYFVAGLRTASDSVKVGFTALWTLATLGVVIRGLTRVRRARINPPSGRQ